MRSQSEKGGTNFNICPSQRFTYANFSHSKTYNQGNDMGGCTYSDFRCHGKGRKNQYNDSDRLRRLCVAVCDQWEWYWGLLVHSMGVHGGVNSLSLTSVEFHLDDGLQTIEDCGRILLLGPPWVGDWRGECFLDAGIQMFWILDSE